MLLLIFIISLYGPCYMDKIKPNGELADSYQNSICLEKVSNLLSKKINGYLIIVLFETSQLKLISCA